MRVGSQLQGFRSFRGEKGWVYEIKFFPGPKKGVWVFRAQETSLLSLSAFEADDLKQMKLQWEAKPDPVQLFMRAHVLNRRLTEIPGEFCDSKGREGVVFNFEGGALLKIFQEGTHSLVDIEVEVPGKKDFVRHIQLEPVNGELGVTPSNSLDISNLDSSIAEGGTAEKGEVKASKKQEVLISRIQSDIDESRVGLRNFDEVCAYIQSQPMAWGILDGWPEATKQQVDLYISEGLLPAFKIEMRAQAQDKIFSLRKRFVRKVQGAEKRMKDVLAKAELAAAESQEKVLVTREKLQPKKPAKVATPGLTLQHSSGIIALVGKKQSDNADLFRKAHPRDLWFHIRGLGGAHVWIPRGQKGLSFQKELLPEIRHWAAQLALYNSKARSSNYGMVDMAEKRYLKTIKGQPGHLIINRSEALATELDDEFHKWLESLS